MTSPLAMWDVQWPSKGYPFAWAQCPTCGQGMAVKFGPVMGVTEQEARNAASDWAENHTTCHPAGKGDPTTIAELRAEEHRADAMFGLFEEQA